MLDTSRLDFNKAVLGRKSAETLVICAKGGEEIVTRNAQGKVEATCVAKAGDAIFVNLHDRNDTYIPSWPYSELLNMSFAITGIDKAAFNATWEFLPKP